MISLKFLANEEDDMTDTKIQAPNPADFSCNEKPGNTPLRSKLRA